MSKNYSFCLHLYKNRETDSWQTNSLVFFQLFSLGVELVFDWFFQYFETISPFYLNLANSWWESGYNSYLSFSFACKCYLFSCYLQDFFSSVCFYIHDPSSSLLFLKIYLPPLPNLMPFKIKNSPDLICVHILGGYGGIRWDLVSLLEAKVKYKIVKVHSQVSLCTQVAYQPIEGALYLWYCFFFLSVFVWL